MLDKNLIKQICQKGAVYWSRHLFKRMVNRDIKESDIVLALEEGEIIEQYIDDYTYPSCLILCFLPNGKPIHVACSLRHDTLNLTTAYYPDNEIWLTDYKTRRMQR